MKQLLFFVAILSVLMLSACGTGGDENYQNAMAKIAQLEEEKIELAEDRELLKEEYNEVIETLNDIDLALQNISARENQMENLIGDLRGGDLQKEVILAKIESLKDANMDDQSNAKELQESLNAFETDNSSLKKIIQQYEDKIVAKDVEIANYEVKIKQIESQLQYTESELNKQYAVVAQQKDALEVKTDKLENTNKELEKKFAELKERDEFIADCVKGYYVAGSKKTLKGAGILKRKVAMQVTDGFQKKLDRTKPFNFYKKTDIEVKKDIIKILPERPASTYSIADNVLRIKDAEEFWQTKHVVIIHK